jgi:TonB family protein
LNKAGVWLAVAMVAAPGTVTVRAQTSETELVRKAKSKVAPTFPDLARKMGISGVVKVQVTVAPNGTVAEAKLVGGHPLLATAALDAVKKWRFEAAATGSTGVVEFKFEPRQ